MKNLKSNKNFYILFLIVIVLAAILFYLTFVLTPGKGLIGNIEVDEETLSQDYSNLNTLTPGQDTLEDVLEISGEPSRVEDSDGKTYLFYSNPFDEDGNYVVLKNNKVDYVFEYVFGEYRGTRTEYIEQRGEPSLELTGVGGHGLWSVFLTDGVMIATSGEKINSIIYFVPQDIDTFINGLAKELGLSTTSAQEGSGAEAFYGPDS